MTAPSAAGPIFVVPVRDLDDGPKTLSGEISTEWLQSALAGTEATPADRAGSLELQLSKNGREVLVRGIARVPVVVPCARTLAPIPLDLAPEIFLLLRKAEGGDRPQRPGAGSHDSASPRAKSKAGRGKRERGDATRPDRTSGDHGTRAQHRQAPQQRQEGQHQRGGWPEDPELEPIDAAQDTYEGEQIVLDGFLREFILLELPMFPVRQDLPSLPVEARPSGPDRQNPDSRAPSTESETPLDPRLAPLAELKDRLRQKQKQNKE